MTATLQRRTFISYSHDSVEHRDEVLALAERLRRNGARVVIDADRLPGGPDEGWPAWSEAQVLESDIVLVICTRDYARRYDLQEAPGTGLGTVCEARTIRQSLYDSGGKNDKFRVVLLRPEYEAFIPSQLKGYHHFRSSEPDGYATLLQWIGGAGEPASVSPQPASTFTWPPPAPRHQWRLADRKTEQALVQDVFSGTAAQRILLVEGPSGVGKSALMREVLRYARALGIEHALADFKGSPTLSEVIDGLLLDLGESVLPNTATATGTGRRSRLLLDLQQRSTPLLLVFDTYEQASDEAREWIENQFLRRLHRAPGALIVLSGQQVPRRARQEWSELAARNDLKSIDEPDHWLDYGRRVLACPRVTREHVESLTVALAGHPAQVAALLESFVRYSEPGTGASPR